jgi:hypothetical protein
MSVLGCWDVTRAGKPEAVRVFAVQKYCFCAIASRNPLTPDLCPDATSPQGSDCVCCIAIRSNLNLVGLRFSARSIASTKIGDNILSV